jgi:hypothetical protein
MNDELRGDYEEYLKRDEVQKAIKDMIKAAMTLLTEAHNREKVEWNLAFIAPIANRLAVNLRKDEFVHPGLKSYLDWLDD